MSRCLFSGLMAGLMCSSSLFAAESVRLVFDTDIGGDIDDAMALAVIHALQNRNECRLLAVTTLKTFTPGENGKHRHLTVTPEQIAMVREAFAQLCSEPPKR